ncbi:unnamed protein product, partial [marine sediment metagenome]
MDGDITNAGTIFQASISVMDAKDGNAIQSCHILTPR